MKKEIIITHLRPSRFNLVSSILNESWQSVFSWTLRLWEAKQKSERGKGKIKYLDFSGNIDSTKFSFSEGFTDLEVLQWPLPLLIAFFLLILRTHFMWLWFWTLEIPKQIWNTSNLNLLPAAQPWNRHAKRMDWPKRTRLYGLGSEQADLHGPHSKRNPN